MDLKLIFGSFFIFTISLVQGRSLHNHSRQENAIYESFKHNLIRYYGVSESFAEQFKVNLRRAVNEEKRNQLLRQIDVDDDDEDETEVPSSTTQGPSPFNIVNGIYGILQGVGTLNPDRVFTSTVNFFPPSQKNQAQALIDSALGQRPSTWPTTPSTTTPKPTTTTKDPDDDDDEDEDKKVTAAAVAVVAVATKAPVVAATVATSAPVQVTAAVVKQLDDEDEADKPIRG